MVENRHCICIATLVAFLTFCNTDSEVVYLLYAETPGWTPRWCGVSWWPASAYPASASTRARTRGQAYYV